MWFLATRVISTPKTWFLGCIAIIALVCGTHMSFFFPCAGVVGARLVGLLGEVAAVAVLGQTGTPHDATLSLLTSHSFESAAGRSVEWQARLACPHGPHRREALGEEETVVPAPHTLSCSAGLLVTTATCPSVER